MKNKFNIGDKVITEVLKGNDGYSYYITPTDTPWFPLHEKNLYLAGTFRKEDFNLELNNGIIAKFLHCDDNANKIYSIEHKEQHFNIILLNDSIFYSISSIDFSEPGYPLKEEFQPNQKHKKDLL